MINEDKAARPRAKLLVVDDLYANRVTMRQVLGGLDVDLVEAASGNEALALCLEHEFALILLDVQMPDMDGVEVAQLLNGEERTRNVPLIFVTAGSSDHMERLKGYDVGAVDYLVKPISSSLLSAKVRNFIDLYESRRALTMALDELDQRNGQLQVEIEERRRAEDNARHLAAHDALTGLPNRLQFIEQLEAAIGRAQRHGERLALGYMDLDGFKAVNDAHGHRAGDAVLKAIAKRLSDHIRVSDTAARLGGDEFALIFESIGDDEAYLNFCRTLRNRLARPIAVPSRTGPASVSVGVSLGLALYPDHGSDPDSLMHNADNALYGVKHDGKADVRLYGLA